MNARWLPDKTASDLEAMSARNRASHVKPSKIDLRPAMRRELVKDYGRAAGKAFDAAQVAKPSAELPQMPSRPPDRVRGPDIQPRKSKFSNVWTVADGIKFQSKREARRYQELALLESAGKIKFLTLQIKLSCDVNGIHICDYRADFRYIDANTGLSVIEDAKGYKTREYRIKKKLVKACLGIEIVEV